MVFNGNRIGTALFLLQHANRGLTEAMDKNKLKLTIILVAITVPLMLSTLLYEYSVGDLALPQGISSVLETLRVGKNSLGTNSRGTLIQPVLDIGELGLTDQDGKSAYQTFGEIEATVKLDDYKSRPWQVFYLGSSACDAVCQERLYFLRQLHIRLGSESARLQRVYVLTAPAPAQVDAATLAYLQTEQADMRIVNVDPAKLAEVLARTTEAGADPQAEHYLYVMDPVGNIMLYFTPSNDAEQMLKDIDKLLDNSSLG
jgi:hypothetical protein